ncbi:hypothetical protein JTB14_006248 [Gonioctena quinquepunctata]|nr:hypothetical protein JTB14_006248 [Gonioctena quinquepunctata]
MFQINLCIHDLMLKSFSEIINNILKLAVLKLRERCEIVTPEAFPDEVFLRNHTRELYERLRNISKVPKDELEHESSNFDSTYFAKDTFDCAKSAADAALTLTLKVSKGELKNGFALIRPPGHHAMQNEFCGYCFINNVAVAAQAAIDRGFAKRVLIVDHDVHHGQGIQRMFYNRNDVLYFSIHRYEQGLFWPNLRESDADYIGEGRGKGFNINVPLNATGLGDTEYLAIILNILLPVAYEYDPDLILICAGYDAAIGCPEGQMMVTPHFYANLIALLSGLANGKIVVCLEGGYFPESIAEGVACSLKALLGDICYPIDIPSKPEIHPAADPMFGYPKEGSNEDSLKIDIDKEHLTTLSFEFTGPEPTIPYETTGFYPVRTKEENEKFLNMVTSLRNDYANGREYRNIIGYVYDEEFLKHKPAHETGRSLPEKPERLLQIIKYFEKFGLLERCQKIQISHTDAKEWIEKTHDKVYVNNILTQENITEKPDWFFNKETNNCVLKCVSGILSLAQSIHEGTVRAGVAVIRPPGHHATFDNGSGFCFVNNVVIAAKYLIEKHNYKRILIVDFDIHHGNGTQNLTYNRSDIMYISVHRFDEGKFFPSNSKGDYTYAGENEGESFNVNIPFNKNNKTDTDYWMVWLKLVLPLAFSYKPDFILVSAGFDAGYFDPIGNGYKLTPEIFGHFIQTLKPLASGKILLTLEGGYHIDTTALSMTMCVKALLGDPLPVPKFQDKLDADTLQTIQNVIGTHKDKWKMLKVNKKIANFSCTDIEKNVLEEASMNDGQDVETANKIAAIVKKAIKPNSTVSN